MQKIYCIPDAIGLMIMMPMIAIIAAFISPDNIPRPLWIAIYLAWAASAIFVWHKYIVKWERWPLVAAYSIGGAIIWYGATRFISYLIFGNEEPELSKIFDLVVALIISPGLTFIAIAGWIRGLIQKKLTQSVPP